MFERFGKSLITCPNGLNKEMQTLSLSHTRTIAPATTRQLRLATCEIIHVANPQYRVELPVTCMQLSENEKLPHIVGTLWDFNEYVGTVFRKPNGLYIQNGAKGLRGYIGIRK